MSKTTQTFLLSLSLLSALALCSQAVNAEPPGRHDLPTLVDKHYELKDPIGPVSKQEIGKFGQFSKSKHLNQKKAPPLVDPDRRFGPGQQGF